MCGCSRTGSRTRDHKNQWGTKLYLVVHDQRDSCGFMCKGPHRQRYSLLPRSSIVTDQLQLELGSSTRGTIRNRWGTGRFQKLSHLFSQTIYDEFLINLYSRQEFPAQRKDEKHSIVAQSTDLYICATYFSLPVTQSFAGLFDILLTTTFDYAKSQ